MIIIPEIKTVVILVPRTGTGALRRAVAEQYPEAMLIYRHMEADGVPLGYDRWPRVGVLRHPLDRLWSLYHFLRTFGDTEHQRRHDAAYIKAMRAQVAISFEEWVLYNQTIFTGPYDSSGRGRFFPHYTVRHPLPENRKSQFLYLRPDLGTTIYAYENVGQLHERLNIKPARHNASNGPPPPLIGDLSAGVRNHIETWFAWDLEQHQMLAHHTTYRDVPPARLSETGHSAW